jgi:hypothetical protein
MVQMKVCVQHMLQGKTVGLNVILQALLFFRLKATRIDDHGLVGLVREYEAVHGEHIEFEFLYFHSISFYTTE